MAEHVTESSVADPADPISHAVLSKEGSLFVRQILLSAVENPVGLDGHQLALANALLANVLMNDVLNGWNGAGLDQVAQARKAVGAARESNLPLMHHAEGLILRFEKNHDGARQAFERAAVGDPSFARALAQIGNQWILLGEPGKAHENVDKAIKLSPNHPASGYFYWIKGRAFFHEEKWDQAVKWLAKSVEALPTVPYNRYYLACAQHHAAKNTLQTFINHPGLEKERYQLIVSGAQSSQDHDPQRNLREGLEKIKDSLGR